MTDKPDVPDEDGREHDRDTDYPEGTPSEPAERGRRRLERILPEILKRAIERGFESGIETLANSGEALRGVVGDNVKLPKEVASYIFAQVDETKNGMVRVVAREVRDFLSATDIAHELQRALTSLSFEIRTEIRFIPNDSGGIRPEVKAEVEPKRSRRNKKRDKDEPEDE